MWSCLNGHFWFLSLAERSPKGPLIPPTHTPHSTVMNISYHVTFSPDNGLMKEESEDWKDTDSKAVDSFLKTLLLWTGLLPLKETVAGEIFI